MNSEPARLTASRKRSVAPDDTDLKSDVMSAVASCSLQLVVPCCRIRVACPGLTRPSARKERPGGLRLKPEGAENCSIASLGSLGAASGHSSSLTLAAATAVGFGDNVAASAGAPAARSQSASELLRLSLWPPACMTTGGAEESFRRASKCRRTCCSKCRGSQVPR